jgi:outer membrane murein-binding lipoprotein Lpp
VIACARLIAHFRGLTWSDVRAMQLQDFNALVEQMAEDMDEERKDMKRAQRGGRGGGSAAQGERRTPVMT